MINSITYQHNDTELLIKYKLKKRYPGYKDQDYNIYPIYVSVKNNDLNLATELINNQQYKLRNYGGEIESVAHGDTSLLHIAVENNNIEMLELLLTIYRDLSFRDLNGDTALSKAIHNNNEKATELLKNHNKDPNNELNPYYNIIQYVTKATGIDSRGSTMASKRGIISFTKSFLNESKAFADQEHEKIKSKIFELKNKLNINITEEFKRTYIRDFHSIYINLLLSFDEAKRVDKQLKAGIIGAAEGFASATPGLDHKYIGEYIAKYIDPIDTARLRKVCKSVENSYRARVAEINNTNNQQSR